MGKFKPDEDQIKTDRSGGLYANQGALNSRVVVKPSNFNAAQTVTPASAQFILLDNTHITSGTAQKDTVAVEGGLNNGIMGALLPGAVGTASLNTLANSNGDVINIVEIVDPSTNDPILDGGDRVWGLIQFVSTANNGDAIGAPASENTQMSFVKYNASDALVLVTLNQQIQFSVNRGFSIRYLPDFLVEGRPAQTDVIDTIVPAITETFYEITAAFAIGEILNLTTGAGDVSGTSTVVGVTPVLPASGALYKSNGNVAVYQNGVLQYKGAGGGDSNDVDWDSTNTIETQNKWKVGEIITVKAQDQY